MIQKEEPLKTEHNIEKPKIEHNKKYLYVNEQKEIIKKLFKILGIDNNKKTFCGIEIDEHAQKEIINLIPDIKKYFKVSNWSCLKIEQQNEKIYLSIIKNLLKSMKINFSVLYKPVKIGTKHTSVTLYMIDDDVSIFNTNN